MFGIAAFGRSLAVTGSSPAPGTPETTLQRFLRELPPRVESGVKRDDMSVRTLDIAALAGEVDRWADTLDTSTDGDAANISKGRLDASRIKLCAALVDLRKTIFWSRTNPVTGAVDRSVPPGGCGLLDVRTWIQQRDPSVFKMILELLTRLDDDEKKQDVVWSLEARCFVYPEKGPLEALLESMKTVEVPWGVWAAPFIESLRADEFWAPDGTKSLDKLLEAVKAEPGTGSEAARDMSESDVRRELDRFNWEWARVRKALRGNIEDEKTLRGMLKFRKALTDRLMSDAVSKIAPRAMVEYNDAFRWIRYSVPGSTRLTSDIDVNMRGSATERVAIEFNEQFRIWVEAGEPRPATKLESGYVFDVNVYAQDYTRETGLRFMKPDVPDQDFWPRDGSAEWKAAERWQDIYALLKMRRYMDDVRWVDFKQHVTNSLGSSAAGREFKSRVEEVRKLWTEQIAEAAREERIVDAIPGMAAYPNNRKVRAENNRYERQLQTVFELRARGKKLDDLQKVALAEALGKASFLAQEAYHTSGAVRDVVCNLQMGQGLALSMCEQLHSFNEQVGDIFKDLGHFPGDSGAKLEFAVDASKYMVRMASASLGANYNLVTQVLATQFSRLEASPPGTAADRLTLAAQETYAAGLDERLNGLLNLQETFETWRGRALQLMKIKDNPAAYKVGEEWTAEARRLLADAPWAGERSGFATVLLKLAVKMNVEARSDPGGTLRGGLTGGGARAQVAISRASAVAL